MYLFNLIDGKLMWDGPKISSIEKDIEAHFQIAIDGAAWNDSKVLERVQLKESEL